MNLPNRSGPLREQALAIWHAAVDWARPSLLIPKFLSDPSIPIREAASSARRIIVVGAGKAGAAMSAALEDALPDCIPKMEGVVNVPAESLRPLRAIRLHAARPVGANHPTAEGVVGAGQILDLFDSAGAEDLGICLLSGGGSALLPAPACGVSLEDKQIVTRLLHECGATINEMNAVRKHLSRIKGGRLAQAFMGRSLYGLIISDVIGDPLDVIASGPTAPDPTTFADALAVLDKYGLKSRFPTSVLDFPNTHELKSHALTGILDHLNNGVLGLAPETPKSLPSYIRNFVIGNNAGALAAAQAKAEQLGFPVLNLGSSIEGETQDVGTAIAVIVRGILAGHTTVRPPVCLLSGGETTVTLDPIHGLGGRNQEFVLAAAIELGPNDMDKVVILSGGTDGEDGPTDAAGALADGETLRKADKLGMSPIDFLKRHDAYHFFQPLGGLIITGLTQTNVMDVRVLLIGS